MKGIWKDERSTFSVKMGKDLEVGADPSKTFKSTSPVRGLSVAVAQKAFHTI